MTTNANITAKQMQLMVDVVYDGHRHRRYVERTGEAWSADAAFEQWNDSCGFMNTTDEWDAYEPAFKKAWSAYVDGRDLSFDFPSEMRRAAEESRCG